ncbi:Importin alpha subunit (Karyopherin alpha subunit) (Serine-rich RNA polymerase I suppressor protein) [Tulasnella sp. 417]|nr:Importin alpha subunit (Karyopherin alpha subunit) (Serine-rich RNA polymerase I suppressor protein) [Tulasnella sp. 417]
MKHLIPRLARYIQENRVDTEEDQDYTSFAIQSFTYMLDCGIKRSDIIETGVAPRLFHFLADSSSGLAVQIQAMNCIGTLTEGDASDRDVLLEAGMLPALLALLDSEDPGLCRAALWCACMLVTGSQSHVDAVLDSGFLKPAACILADDQCAPDCRYEACWLIAKLSKKIFGDMKMIQAFIDDRCVEGLSAALRLPQTRRRATAGIENLLGYDDSQMPQGGGPFEAILRASSCPQNLRAIRFSREDVDENLLHRCDYLLTHYFPEYSKRARV